MWIVKYDYALEKALAASERLKTVAEAKIQYSNDGVDNSIALNASQDAYFLYRGIKKCRGNEYVILSVTEFAYLAAPKEDEGEFYRSMKPEFF